MRALYIIFTILFAFQKVIFPAFFFVLSVFTAPEDISETLKESKMILDKINGNPLIDVALFILLFGGLIFTFGSGNWRLVFHRYASKKRLERLADDAKKVAEDTAYTLSQFQQTAMEHFSRGDNEGSQNQTMPRMDQRFLSKHMLETHAIKVRLKEAGYWNWTDSQEFMNSIGFAGATQFSAEATAKSIYAASEQIRCDLQDGFWTLLTKPVIKDKPIPTGKAYKNYNPDDRQAPNG